MALSIIIGIAIGLILGLTGAGGSVFAMPLLVFLLGLPIQQAIGISLGAVFVSALFGVLTNLRSSDIQWLPAIVFAVIGATISPLGVWAAHLLSTEFLMLVFALLVVLIATRMWREASANPEDSKVVRASSLGVANKAPLALCRANNNRPFELGLPCAMGISAGALSTGFLSGLLGVGGGFLIIPTLMRLTGIGIKQAVASSLLVITIISGTAFCTFITSGNNLETTTLFLVALGGVSGMLLGRVVSKHIAGTLLQKTFSIMMIIMASIIIFSALSSTP